MANKVVSAPTERLFGSKTRTKLLTLFFENPDKSYYIREITRVIGEQVNSVRRELMNLDSLGVVKNEMYDNKAYYSANDKHPFFRPLIEIFARQGDLEKRSDIRKSSLTEYARPVKNYLTAALITNRLPGQSGLDLVIIGDDRTKKLTVWAEVVEKKMGKPLNFTILTKEDFVYRRRINDRFISDALALEVAEKYDPGKIL